MGNDTKLPYQEWQNDAEDYLYDEVGLAGLLDKEDPYGVSDAMQAAFQQGLTPQQFIKDRFAEEFESAPTDPAPPIEGAAPSDILSGLIQTSEGKQSLSRTLHGMIRKGAW